MSKRVECCISQLSLAFYAKQRAPNILSLNTYIYFSFILHMASGLVAALLLLGLIFILQLKGLSPPGACCSPIKEKEHWSNHPVVLKVSVFWRDLTQLLSFHWPKKITDGSPAVRGLIQEGQQISETNKKGQYRWGQEDSSTFTEDSGCPRELDPGKHWHILYNSSQSW